MQRSQGERGNQKGAKRATTERVDAEAIRTTKDQREKTGDNRGEAGGERREEGGRGGRLKSE